MLAAIAAGFVSKNVAAEVVNRHRDAVLGREPRWGFVPRRPLAEGEEPTEPEQALADEAGAALTEWWDARRPLETVQRAVALALTTGRATLRLYVPAGLRDQAGKVSAPDLVAALGLIRPHLPEPGTAGVFPDGDLEGVEAETGAEVGVYAISRNNQESAELCYLDEQGGTVLRVVGEGGGEGGGEAAALPLGGRLLLYELTRDALLTPQVRQLQKALNLDLTQMMRNVNLAGSLERVIVNAQKPGRWVDAAGSPLSAEQAKGDPNARFIQEPLPVGAGVSAFLAGLPHYNEAGGVAGYANPSIQWRDPVPVTTFTDTKGALYGGILEEAGQLHALIAEDATASGESRKQARAEFEASLRLTKTLVDGALRWLLETALALAGVFCGRPGAFEALRCEAACQVDAGPLTADERQQIVAEFEKGVFSWETTAVRLGAEDPDAERARLDAERERADQAFLGLTNGNGVTGERGEVGQTQAGQQQPGQGQQPTSAGAAAGSRQAAT